MRPVSEPKEAKLMTLKGQIDRGSGSLRAGNFFVIVFNDLRVVALHVHQNRSFTIAQEDR
jgi:hypothetical protein